MNKNSKNNGRPRDEKGRFVSLSAMYSVKHNTVDLEKVFEYKMKYWREKGLQNADGIISPFKYRPEAFDIPENYYYTQEEIDGLAAGYDHYILEMLSLPEDNYAIENLLLVAKFVPLKRTSLKKELGIKSTLWKKEGLTLLPIDRLNSNLDFFQPFSTEPKGTELLFQGVIAKRKLKDLVIDTCYKLDFNKAIKNHYIHQDTLDDECVINICRFHHSPINIFGYVDVSAVIFTKTSFDVDGDRIIDILPEPKYVITETENRLAAYSIEDGTPIDIRSLDDLVNLVPNLMIPEGLLRRLAKIEFINDKNKKFASSNDKSPTEVPHIDTTSDQPLGFGVRVNLLLDIPNVITVVDDSGNRITNINTYRLGEFRAPRKNGEISDITSFSVDSGQFLLATGPNDLWILIDENLDKIYFYNFHDNKIIDWCLTTTFDFLNLFNKFSPIFLSAETKGDLLEAMNNVLKNYYSKGIISTETNKGLIGLMEKIKND